LTAKPLDILVVDDEQSICLLLHDVLAHFGHQVTTCQEGGTALELAGEQPFDLVFLDIRMPGMGGLEALKELQKLQPEATFVMITGFAKDDIIEEALLSGASACLCKPFSLSHVTEVLDQIKSGQPVSA
jgi:CheY-like chemotaxis protein